MILAQFSTHSPPDGTPLRWKLYRREASIDGSDGSAAFTGNPSIVASEADALGDEEVNVPSELAEDGPSASPRCAPHKRQQDAGEALRDGVTGLPNRSLFLTRLEEPIAEASRAFRPFAVCLLAVDPLREINDMLSRGLGNLAAARDPQVRRRPGLIH